jgi:hypothetical protein
MLDAIANILDQSRYDLAVRYAEQLRPRLQALIEVSVDIAWSSADSVVVDRLADHLSARASNSKKRAAGCPSGSELAARRGFFIWWWNADK